MPKIFLALSTVGSIWIRIPQIFPPSISKVKAARGPRVLEAEGRKAKQEEERYLNALIQNHTLPPIQ
jgi:hypothetical protein